MELVASVKAKEGMLPSAAVAAAATLPPLATKPMALMLAAVW
jgi:hypothetical protein